MILNQIQDLKSSIKFPSVTGDLNGLAAHNFSKVSLLRAISLSKNYDLICLSETFLGPSIDSSDERITIEGYNLLLADHPSNKKRGGVCIYYKEYPPVIKRDYLCNLNECLVLEIKIEAEECFFRVYIGLQVKVKRNVKVFVPNLIYSCQILTI